MATTSDILTASAGNWTLVPDRSKVTFKNKTLWGLATVTGHFTEFRGEGSAGAGVNGHVVIAARSVHSGIRKRDDHLRSADFFDVEAHPDITVQVTGLEPSDDRVRLTAVLTVRGVSKPIELPVDVQVLDHPSLVGDDPGTVAILPGINDAAGRLDLVSIGGEDLIGRGHLIGVYQGLAVEPHKLGLAALGGESINVANVVVLAVEDDDASRPSSQHAQLQRRRHWGTSRHMGSAQLLGEVIGAHNENRQAIRCLGDGPTTQHRARGFDHGPQLDVLVSSSGLHIGHYCSHLLSRADFGNRDGVWPGSNCGSEIVGIPLGVHPVNPDRDLSIPVRMLLHHIGRTATGLNLEVGGHGIF